MIRSLWSPYTVQSLLLPTLVLPRISPCAQPTSGSINNLGPADKTEEAHPVACIADDLALGNHSYKAFGFPRFDLQPLPDLFLR